ncbi:hypothetical protein GDO78_016376 [Eleutherodactylus coqui]|uniref:Uncharacterized protein n=1 Tax=Eleutherodactylus coqui TaxID=57060 RepID=A0A8J6BEW3_ELECQ|nr:hypothetical protein GDO78_016376 [Eleutherodactylus coqui]
MMQSVIIPCSNLFFLHPVSNNKLVSNTVYLFCFHPMSNKHLDLLQSTETGKETSECLPVCKTATEESVMVGICQKNRRKVKGQAQQGWNRTLECTFSATSPRIFR